MRHKNKSPIFLKMIHLLFYTKYNVVDTQLLYKDNTTHFSNFVKCHQVVAKFCPLLRYLYHEAGIFNNCFHPKSIHHDLTEHSNPVFAENSLTSRRQVRQFLTFFVLIHMQSPNPDRSREFQGHFFSTCDFPPSSYSCLEIHICWNEPCKRKKLRVNKWVVVIKQLPDNLAKAQIKFPT